MRELKGGGETNSKKNKFGGVFFLFLKISNLLPVDGQVTKKEFN